MATVTVVPEAGLPYGHTDADVCNGDMMHSEQASWSGVSGEHAVTLQDLLQSHMYGMHVPQTVTTGLHLQGKPTACMKGLPAV